MGIFTRKDDPETTAPPAQPEPSDVAGSNARVAPEPPSNLSDRDRWGDRLEELLERCRDHDLELERIGAELERFAEQQKRQTIAIEEGIQHVDRSERRVRAVVKRAQERLADAGYEDVGVEAEADGLRSIDVPRGGPEGMQTVLEDVDDGDEAAPADWSGIPGLVTPENLRELGF